MSVKLIVITLSLLNSIALIGQSSKEQNICLNLRTEKFIIGLDNPIDIAYPQLKPIQLKDISAEFKHYITQEKRKLEILERNGHFVTTIISTYRKSKKGTSGTLQYIWQSNMFQFFI